MASSIWVMPARLRRNLSKSPKVMNFSRVLDGMVVGMTPLSLQALPYSIQNLASWRYLSNFVKLGQIMQMAGCYSGNTKDRVRNLQAQIQPVKGDRSVEESFVPSVDGYSNTCTYSLWCTNPNLGFPYTHSRTYRGHGSAILTHCLCRRC
jgi:hypothetical protein